MFKRIGLYITLFWSFTSQAQYVSIGGTFSIDNQRGCRDMPVTVTNTVPPPANVVVLFLYEGRGSSPTPDTTYTYTNSGTYWLYRFIQNDPQRIDSIQVEIIDPVIPDFELNACGLNEVQVDIQDNNYDLYEINYGDGTIDTIPVNSFPPTHAYASGSGVSITLTGLYSTANNRCGGNSKSFTPVNQVQPAQFNLIETLDNQTIAINYTLAPNTRSSLEIDINNSGTFQLYKNIDQGSATDTLTNLQLVNNVYCFRIASHDACSNFKSYSNTLCTVYAQTQAVNNAINTSWQTAYPPTYTGTAVIRNSSLLTTLTGAVLAYTDTTVVCNTDYCFQIATQHSDGSISRSNTVCAEAFSTDTPAPVADVSAQVIDNTVSWTWLVPSGETAQLFKVYNDQSQLIASTQDTTIATSYNEEGNNCITIQMTNICDNESALSTLVCPLLLNRTLNGDGSVSLSWNEYQGWQNGVNTYSLVIYDQNMNAIDSINVNNDLEYTDPLPTDDNQVRYYRVWASANDTGIYASGSNLLRVELPVVIGIPSAFTPNGDNLNDEFIVTGKFIQSIELTILNRWGSTIYHTNTNTWDGLYKGEKVPVGNYIYNIIVKDFAGNEHIRTGTVLILDN